MSRLPPTPSPSGERRADRRRRKDGLKGPFFMLLSAFLFAVLWFLIKLLGPSFTVWDVAFYRFGGGAVLLPLLFGRREEIFRPAAPLLMGIRGAVGTGAFLALVVAIHSIPFSTAMVFFYSFPAFTAVFTPILFGDRIRAGEIGCILVAMVGVAVLFDFHIAGSATGQIMAVLSAILAGLTVSLIKKLRERHGPVSIYFYLCVAGTVISAGPFLADPRLPQTAPEIAMVLGIIVIAIFAQVLMNQGFHYCKSWEGGILMTSELVFSSIFGILFLGEAAGWRFWLAGLLIFGSAAAFNLQYRQKTPADVDPKLRHRPEASRVV